MNNKVLLLPTYFPTTYAQIIGSQVHEQTEFLAAIFDFKVLYCLPGMGWKRFIFTQLIYLFTRKKVFQSCANQLKPGNLDARGVYYFESRYFSKKLNLKCKVQAYSYLIEQLEKEHWNADLIHARTAEHAGIYAAHLKNKYHIPLLLTENCIFILDEQITINKIKNYRFAIESADEVAVVSNYLKTFLLTNNYNCKPIVVGNMIDERIFQLKPQTDKDHPFILITVGHTGYTKDWVTFFKSIQYLIHTLRIDDIKVIIAITHVYDASSRNYIPDLAKQYNVEEFCDIVFEIPRDKVVNYYHQADVFVSTSINETFGIATCEAMFCGIPVVATANGGIDDFISKENGIKVGLQEYREVAGAILKIKNKEVIFNATTIRESVINKYGTAAFKERLVKLYSDTISKLND